MLLEIGSIPVNSRPRGRGVDVLGSSRVDLAASACLCPVFAGRHPGEPQELPVHRRLVIEAVRLRDCFQRSSATGDFPGHVDDADEIDHRPWWASQGVHDEAVKMPDAQLELRRRLWNRATPPATRSDEPQEMPHPLRLPRTTQHAVAVHPGCARIRASGPRFTHRVVPCSLTISIHRNMAG